MKAATLAMLLSTSMIVFVRPLDTMAQIATPCSRGAKAEGSYGVNQKSGAPFFAIAKETFEQKLPDGNVVNGFARFQQARNQLGATRNEVPLRCFGDQDGTLKLAYSVNTFDPVSKTSFSWSVYGHLVGWAEDVIHVQGPSIATQELGQKEVANTAQSTAAAKYKADEYKEEHLGTRIIHGLTAIGTRTVRVIPAGTEGNEQVVEVMHEHWWSSDLEQDLVVIDDDPRKGRMTYEVEELTFGEPAATLFVLPEGYVKKDIRPM